MRITLALLATAAAFAATPVLADACLDEVKAAMGKSLSSGPVRIESTMTGAATMTMKGELIPPGNMHMVSAVAGTVTEMTVLDGKAWMNVGGTWQELPVEMASQFTAAFTAATTNGLDVVTEAKCEGTVNIDGKDLKSYSFNVTVDGNSTANRIFVDPAIGAPVRNEIDIDIDGTMTKSVTTTTYDPSITITAPAM